MKNLLGLFLALLLISGCAYFDSPRSQYNRLVGDWRYQDASKGELVLRFKKNQTYEVDFENDGKKDIWGHIDFWFDKLKFSDEEGIPYTECREPGFYGYNVKNNKLEFAEFADECPPRKTSLSVSRIKFQDLVKDRS